MIGNPMEMRGVTHQLTVSLWALTSIATLYESGLAALLSEPRALDELVSQCKNLSPGKIERCLAVVHAAGVVARDGERYRLAEGAIPFLQPGMRASLIGDIRTNLMQALHLVDESARAGTTDGWIHTDRVLLQGQGDASASLAPMLKMHFVPSMSDLGARLEEPGARFLDVGVGVAALSIAMCRVFPKMNVVGVDSYEVPLAIGRDNIARAGLGDRIELRQLEIEALRDEDSFDLAWLPSFFIDRSVLPAAAARVRASLKPGGWVLFPIGTSGGDELNRAVFALLSETWGGPALSIPEAESLLKEAGFSGVKALPGPTFAPALLIGQR